jgi:TRAP-type C4-dicarboxylate transport system permease small subunit
VFPIIEKYLIRVLHGFNLGAGVCICGMMLLTCSDVFMRIFRRPIPGTYELVGFMGALFAAFSLAYTSYQRGHIAVDFLVQKFSTTTRAVIMGVNDLIGASLFVLIAAQCVRYGNNLKLNGEVSMTLQLPVYPVLYGIALGCGLLGLFLLFMGVSNWAKLIRGDSFQ